MQSVAVIGANGYVGKEIYASLLRSQKYSVIAVTRENYNEAKQKNFDFIINSAMPAARFLV